MSFRCLSCPHTTADHQDHGKGACLIVGCACVKMQPGEAYKPVAEIRLSPEAAKALAMKRGAEERALKR